MREHVVAASKAMRNGDWKKCRDLIINDKMNGKVTIEISLPKVLCTSLCTDLDPCLISNQFRSHFFFTI